MLLRLPYRAPFDWAGLRSFFEHRAIRGLEVWDGDSHARAVRVGDATGVVRIEHAADEHALLVDVPAELAAHAETIAAQSRLVFDLQADPRLISGTFTSDPLLGPIVRRHPGIRVPGAWDPFEIVIRAIVGQQISVAGARTLLGRMTEQVGDRTGDGWHLFPTPAQLARAELTGMPASRLATIRAVSEAVASGELKLEGNVPVPERVSSLMSVRGIGPWTATYVAMRAFADRDAFPAGDLGLRKAAGLQSARALEKISDAWRPWRAYASLLLWTDLSDGDAS